MDLSWKLLLSKFLLFKLQNQFPLNILSEGHMNAASLVL